ncbi:hypothetical protein FN846DRAFT_509213 [Sphaerosporella brunnea]|uniref:Uncharacterized protein n=1 Tax=Sphaerosporella brunnea TaxID=1250544 RepID=A0A5J5F3A3_9PEZI|nr:hypothetical protein FN846DRAFT_509213 [Sphaerosporella brunnea]
MSRALVGRFFFFFFFSFVWEKVGRSVLGDIKPIPFFFFLFSFSPFFFFFFETLTNNFG